MFRGYKIFTSVSGGIIRNFSSLQAKSGSRGSRLLKINFTEGSKRFMSGHGPDISKLEAAVYILFGGGSFAAFGLYQAKSMRNRIEAFETGKTIPFKTMTDDEYAVYKEKFRKIHSEEEDDDDTAEEDTQTEQEQEAEPEESVASETPESTVDDSTTESTSKDTIIFVEAPEEEE